MAKLTESHITWFNTVMVDYIAGDIKTLVRWSQEIKPEDRRTGPLLQVACNAIDALGGFLRGFDRGTSKARSIWVLSQRMGFRSEEANFLYKVIRVAADQR